MISVILYVNFLFLTWELFLPCLVLLRCPKKREKPLLQTFLPRYKFMHLDRVMYPLKHHVNPALIVLMSYFRFNFTYLAYNTLVREIDSDRTGANILKK